jgi:hypothetical protein
LWVGFTLHAHYTRENRDGFEFLYAIRLKVRLLKGQQFPA